MTLSVVKLSTGGAVSTTTRGQSTQNVNLPLDNEIYLGKLPAPVVSVPLQYFYFGYCEWLILSVGNLLSMGMVSFGRRLLTDHKESGKRHQNATKFFFSNEYSLTNTCTLNIIV